MPKLKNVTFKPLEITGFIKGQCFICGAACQEDYYCHYPCAEAYEDKKKQKKQEETTNEQKG